MEYRSQIHRFTHLCLMNDRFTDSPPLRSVDYCYAILTHLCRLFTFLVPCRQTAILSATNRHPFRHFYS